MNWRDEDTLLDIIIAARRIIEFQKGQSKAEFMQDAKTQSAIQHQLMIMGEAVKRLSDEFRAQHSELPWSPVAGMRDRLIHAYEKVSLDIVWDTIVVAVPDFLSQLESISPGETDENK